MLGGWGREETTPNAPDGLTGASRTHLEGKTQGHEPQGTGIPAPWATEKDLLEKVKGLVEKFWQQGVKVFEDCRVSAKS